MSQLSGRTHNPIVIATCPLSAGKGANRVDPSGAQAGGARTLLRGADTPSCGGAIACLCSGVLPCRTVSSSRRWIVKLVAGLATMSAANVLASEESSRQVDVAGPPLNCIAVQLDARAKCILECAEAYPELGDDYDDCVERCPEELQNADGIIELSAPTDSPNGVGEVTIAPEVVQQAIAWAADIQAMRMSSSSPEDLVDSLRSFFDTDWGDEVLRARFVDPWFVAVIDEMVHADDELSDVAPVVRDLVIELAQVKHLHGASRTGRVGVLRLARQFASEEERASVEGVAAYYAAVEAGTTADAPDAPVVVQLQGSESDGGIP